MTDIGPQVGGALALVALALAASQVFGLVKYALAKDANGVVSNVVYFVATFALLLLAANSSWTENLVIPAIGVQLATLDIGSLVIVSLGAYGVGGFLFDRTKARDDSQSAAQPSLLNGTVKRGDNV